MSICLITGGGSGIGLASAIQLSKKHDIIICGRNDKKLKTAQKIIEKNTKNKVYTYAADVSKQDQVIEIFNKIKETNQTLIACVNAAGVLIKENFIDLKTSTMQEIFQASVHSTFLCSQQTFKLMKQQKSQGCIVNISSLAGIRGVQKFPGMSAYVAAKHAVCGLTEAMAVEGKPLGIHVNCIAPGAVDTDMLKIAGIECDSKLTPCLIAKIVTEFCDQESLGRSTGTIYEIYN